ncbi:hypothetical protein [Antiquaquibacter soli]|uniref:Polynucleotide kinase n=1 Tax=Antiquaquibacter soli TaxID=3064523 RepID=A0ABT9BUI3_9MICO|nr:hypothetical protein [Protaetiibacter sp. WY-16]MDO7883436.1 hypothetical protein [Protaetiibacter sp. WY-16]
MDVPLSSPGPGRLSAADFHSWSTIATCVLAASHRLTRGSRPVVADLDGTLTDPGHRRHHLASSIPDWLAFSLAAKNDPPLLPEIEWLDSHSAERPVVIVSGRPSIAMQLTQSWLERHEVRWDAIVLRPPGDTVRGLEHKMRVLTALSELGIEPEFAFDDSSEARDAYEARGVECRTLPGTTSPSFASNSTPDL